MLCSLQYEVMENVTEINISNLFWSTEYCISVEPNVASRHIHAIRTAEQCVSIGKGDSKWWGSRGKGVPCGTWSLLSLLALGAWGSAPGQPLRAPAAGPSCSVHPGLCLSPPHLGMASLAESLEFVPSIFISSFITLLLLSLLGILLVCTYIKKPVRPPSVLVRQPDTRHSEGAGCGSCWEVISRDGARLTPCFSLPPRKLS